MPQAGPNGKMKEMGVPQARPKEKMKEIGMPQARPKEEMKESGARRRRASLSGAAGAGENARGVLSLPKIQKITEIKL